MLLLHSMWKSCSTSRKQPTSRVYYTFATILLLLLLLHFLLLLQTRQTKKKTRWLESNECTIDKKILYILPITIDDDDDVVINEHKKFYWVSKGAIHRAFNNVVKGPRNFIYWLFLCEKEMCALFLWLKVHNSLFKWTFLICSCLYPAQLVKNVQIYILVLFKPLLELLLLISQKKVVKKFSIFLDRLGSRKRLREFCLGKFPSWIW